MASFVPESLEKVLLQDNYFFLLQVSPGWGIPLRAVAHYLFPYEYDPLAVTYNAIGEANPSMNAPIAAGAFVSPFKLSSNTLNSQDVFQPNQRNTLYQMFFGWTPRLVRFYKSVPLQIRLGSLDNVSNTWGPTTPQFGYTDDSEMDEPSAATEVILPQGMEFGPAVYNPYCYTVAPLWKVWVNYLTVVPVTDVTLVGRLLAGVLGTTKSISANNAAQGVNLKQIYGRGPVPLDATVSELREWVKSGSTPKRATGG